MKCGHWVTLAVRCGHGEMVGKGSAECVQVYPRDHGYRRAGVS